MKKKYIVAIALIVSVCISGYFYLTKTGYSSIPVAFGRADTPLARVEIQGKEYPLEIDFGSKFQLTLSKEVLDRLEKKPYGMLQGRDFKGNTYESPAYLISKIKIGNHIFRNVIAKELNDDYVKNIILFTNHTDSNRYGMVGRGLLEQMNVFLDFRNSIIFECDDIAKLKDAGYSLENLIAVPFEMGRTGAIITVSTDIGGIKLSIDTGSTVSFIRTSLAQDSQSNIFKTSKFAIGNKDFGMMDLHLLAITPELHEIDGILGMDFLKTHVAYIDYRNHLVYFGD